MHITDSPV